MQQTPRLARALGLVKTFETFEPRAVRRADGGWTVGYGHTRTAREGIEVSRGDAEALLLYDLMQVAAVVDRDVQATLNENQREALVAFAFNIGWRDFPKTDVVARLNAGDAIGAGEAIERWRRVERDGARPVVEALVHRRAAETLLYRTPSGGFPTTATPLLRPVRDMDEATEAPPSSPTPSPPTASPPTPSERRPPMIRETPEPTPSEPEPPELEQPESEPAHLATLAEASPKAAPPDPPELATPAPALADEEDVAPPPFADEVASDPFNMPAAANESVPFPAPRPRDAPAAPVYVAANDPAKPRGRPDVRRRSVLRAARRWTWRVSGALGAVLFAAAVTLILSGRPQTWTLLCGLVGVSLMAPTVYALLGRDTVDDG